MTSYTDEQVLSAIEALGSYETMCGFAHILASVHNDRTRLQAELKSEQSRCGDLEQQCEAEAAVASSYFDQIAELQAEAESLRANAKRYRYVRESGSEFVHYTGAGTHGLYEEEELDKRIDGVLRDFIDSARAKKGDL